MGEKSQKAHTEKRRIGHPAASVVHPDQESKPGTDGSEKPGRRCAVAHRDLQKVL